jgi:hypothetical protein
MACVVSCVVAQPTRVTVTETIASVLVVHAKMFMVNAHNQSPGFMACSSPIGATCPSLACALLITPAHTGNL